MKILCKARGGQKITSQSFQKSSQEHPNSIWGIYSSLYFKTATYIMKIVLVS